MHSAMVVLSQLRSPQRCSLKAFIVADGAAWGCGHDGFGSEFFGVAFEGGDAALDLFSAGIARLRLADAVQFRGHLRFRCEGCVGICDEAQERFNDAAFHGCADDAG